MGWRLAEEVAWARPERPGPEWWTLMDIAQDARDDTRLAKPGLEYLMQRGKCSKATIFRRLKTLTDDGLLTVNSHAGPGKRTVYAIPVIHRELLTSLNIAETRTGLTNAEPRTSERVSETDPTCLTFDETCLSVSETPSVTPPSSPPSITELAVITPTVEDATPPVDNSQPRFHLNGRHHMSRLELDAWNATHGPQERR